MIVVRVELWSARTGEKTELARMEICNDGGGSDSLADYSGRTLRGRCSTALNRRVTQRTAEIKRWPRQRLHVWNLIAGMLQAMGYAGSSLEAPCEQPLWPEDAAP